MARLLLSAVIGSAACFPLAALAGGQGEGTVVVAPEIVIEQREQRHVELRRALVSGADLPLQEEQPRRLSADERDVLGRELREAMRGVYEQRPQRVKQH